MQLIFFFLIKTNLKNVFSTTNSLFTKQIRKIKKNKNYFTHAQKKVVFL